MVGFHANRVDWSDDLGCTVVTFDEGGAGAEYVMFQRARDESEDVHLERRGQGWSARGGIRRCTLHRNSLRLQVTAATAAQLGGESDFEATFELPAARFRSLQARLRRLFRGMACFVDRSAGERLMRRPPEKFAVAVDRCFVNWFGPASPADGCSHQLIRECETFHGIRLPAPLRTFFLRFGAHPMVGQARGFLFTPEALEVEGEHLVFWMGHEDDREGAWCGVRLAALQQPDPPVERQEFPSEDEAVWVPECRRLSWFLLRTMAWQAAWGLPVRAVAAATPAALETIAARLTLVAPEEPLAGEPLAYAGEGMAACVVPWQNAVRIGARADEHLQELAGEISLSVN